MGAKRFNGNWQPSQMDAKGDLWHVAQALKKFYPSDFKSVSARELRKIIRSDPL